MIEGIWKRHDPPSALLRPFLRVAARGSVVVLADVSLTVGPGEVVGLVGPNGAGKTTLVKVIGGLLLPTQGSVSICGIDALARPLEARARLGVVLADDRGLYWRLTARQNLEFFGVMSGLPPAAARDRTSENLRLVDLPDDDKLVFGYSSGMRSRLHLARALLAEPPLLVLDEPTRSLDEASKDMLWGLLGDLAGAGKSVLVCSHDLESVAQNCHRMVVLAGGRVRFDGDVSELAGAGDTVAAVMASLSGSPSA